MVYIYFFKKVVFCINFHVISGVDWFFFFIVFIWTHWVWKKSEIKI